MKNIKVEIFGYTGCGKTTIARHLSGKLTNFLIVRKTVTFLCFLKAHLNLIFSYQSRSHYSTFIHFIKSTLTKEDGKIFLKLFRHNYLLRLSHTHYYFQEGVLNLLVIVFIMKYARTDLFTKSLELLPPIFFDLDFFLIIHSDKEANYQAITKRKKNSNPPLDKAEISRDMDRYYNAVAMAMDLLKQYSICVKHFYYNYDNLDSLTLEGILK